MSQTADPIVFLNGEHLPLSQAKISVLDRGFLFGDGVYEVIPVFAGHLFRPREHLQRLADSLTGIRIPNPYTIDQWQKQLAKLPLPNEPGDQVIYVHVSRGTSAIRSHTFAPDMAPTVFAMAQKVAPHAPNDATDGVSAITRTDDRWLRCHLKTTTLLANALFRQEAAEAGAVETILIRDDGQVTEGAATNVFIVEQGTILTPPKSNLILPGITRDLVLELAKTAGLPYAERHFTEKQLRNADEIWITGSLREIAPVTRLDGKTVGSGKPGPLWRRIDTDYHVLKDGIRAGRAE
ncbi:MAG: D-amino acid aminotransferase [Chromatiales bacterium]|nr:D-amino acid aminotransferase [Chromatiales bacterium]